MRFAPHLPYSRGHTHEHTSRESGVYWDHPRGTLESDTSYPYPVYHSVWGRVVPDIPAFCRELVAALDENYRVRHTDRGSRWV